MKNYFFLRFFVPRRRESEDARRGGGRGGRRGIEWTERGHREDRDRVYDPRKINQ